MSYQAQTPKFEDCVIGETVRRLGVYVPVYERLLEIARESESKGLRLSWEEDTQPRGVRVSFTSAAAGLSAIHRMNVWAADDGYCIRYTHHVNGKRELYLERVDEEAEGREA